MGIEHFYDMTKVFENQITECKSKKKCGKLRKFTKYYHIHSTNNTGLNGELNKNDLINKFAQCIICIQMLS